MKCKEERMTAIFKQKENTACRIQEYMIPELAEAYDDDDTRAMGYSEVKKSYIYSGKDDRISW